MLVSSVDTLWQGLHWSCGAGGVARSGAGRERRCLEQQKHAAGEEAKDPPRLGSVWATLRLLL